MASLADIRAALVAAVDANLVWPGPGDLQLTPYVKSAKQPPTIEVDVAPKLYHQTGLGAGNTVQRVIVRAYVGVASELDAQETLDLLLADEGETSLAAAIEAATGIGDVIVESDGGHLLLGNQLDGGVYLGSEWQVRVTT